MLCLRLLNTCVVTLLFFITQAYAETAPIEPEIVAIPAGTLLVGSDESDSEAPTRKRIPVKIKAFNVGKYEVTKAEFRRFINATGYKTPKKCKDEMPDRWLFKKNKGDWDTNIYAAKDRHPVVCIGWKGAQAYAAWLAKITDKPYRLLSEMEWEYIAKANIATKYYFGSKERESDICWFENTADLFAEKIAKTKHQTSYRKKIGLSPCDDGVAYASIVGSFAPNAFGVHDILGNVSEYVRDCINPSYDGISKNGSARLDGDCNGHAVRGGNWHWKPRAAYQRGFLMDGYVSPLQGFRIALD